MSDNTYTRSNIELNIDFNKRFDAWEHFCIVAGGWGMLFEVLASGAFDHLNCQHTVEFEFEFGGFGID